MKNMWKKASFVSLIAMVLCISLLAGTTSAWFTGSGSSPVNKAQSGDLRTQLLKYDGTEYKDISGGEGDIFNDANGLNWEPGRTEIVFLAARNSGDLALDCVLIMDAAFGEVSMHSALEYAILPNVDKAAYDEMGIDDWEEFRRHQNAMYGQVVSGECFVTEEKMLLVGETQYFALAVHMKENSDTSYCGGTAIINIKIASTQAPYESGINGSDYDADPTPIKEWESMIGTLTFESNELEPMIAKAGDPKIVYDDSRYESKFVLRLAPGDRAQYSNTAMPQAAGGEFKITGWFKKENADTVVTITYWHRIAEGQNEAVTVELKDEYILIAPPGGWQYFEIPIEQAANANLGQFILNNHSSVNENAGYVYFDDLRYMRVLDENALIAKEWGERLAEEKMESSMVQNSIDNPYAEMEPLSENLLVNGDFSADKDLLLNDKEIKAHTQGWETIDHETYDIVSKITAEGTFYGEAPVGYNDTVVYRRPVPQIHQTIEDIIPGGTYMIKFRYRINKSQDLTASWYGPYVYFSSYGPRLPGIEDDQTIDYSIVRADAAVGGLNTSGDWIEFTQIVTVSNQADRIGFDMCMWLYEGDWCEVDDVQLYLVGYGNQMDLDVLTKFFYTDMGTTTFTADLKEDNFPELKQDKNATVTIAVYDGKKAIWTSDSMKFTGEDYQASVDFDLSLLTEKGAPYVVKATLKDGTGKVVFETSEQVFIYDRPAALAADGSYIKKTPTGETLDFNMAYAITQDHYEKTLEIGCNVMSLSNSQNAEQVLERLDYCLKYGYMGFLNMNWGLYNENDISLKRWVLIDVVSDERVRNHPALLGYCLVDEPWSWGSEADVAANLEEGYRLIREYDKDNIIFSVNNMTQFHGKTAKYVDVLFVDHYDSPAGGTIYEKVTTAKEAVGDRMLLWTAVSTYKEKLSFPTGDQARNEIWQAFLAGSNGIGYYAISYADFGNNRTDYADGAPIPIWDVQDQQGNNIGEDLWNGLKDFYEKEWDIAFDRFGDGEGRAFSEKVAIDDGYIYSSWVDKYGNFYLVVLNVAGQKDVSVQIPLTSDNGKVSVGGYTATVICGSDQAPFTGNGTVNVTLKGDSVVLYQIKPDGAVDFSVLD